MSVASIDDPLTTEEELATLQAARRNARKRKARPVETPPEAAPKKFEPSKEQIFLLNQELDGGPTPRDLTIHTAVTDEGRSQREVAVKYGLSQARVCQIVKAVDAWTLRMADDRYADYTPQQRRRLAENTFRERLNYFYSQTLAAWRASQREETIERDGGLSGDYSVTRPAYGKVCYLELAMRISERIAELDWAGVRSKHREAEAEAEAQAAETEEAVVSEQEPAASRVTEDATSVAAAPEVENRLSPAAPAAAELGAKPAAQAPKYSGVTEKINAATVPGKPRPKRQEPLITPYESPVEDPEREKLYQELQTLLDGLGESEAGRNRELALGG